MAIDIIIQYCIHEVIEQRDLKVLKIFKSLCFIILLCRRSRVRPGITA